MNTSGCHGRAAVGTCASHLRDPGSNPVLDTCEFGCWSPYRTGGVCPPGTPVLTTAQDHTEIVFFKLTYIAVS